MSSVAPFFAPAMLAEVEVEEEEEENEEPPKVDDRRD